MAICRMAPVSIDLYQRHLSPHKGFSCAYRRLYGGELCSAYGKCLVIEAGLWQAMISLRRQFRECRSAQWVLRAARDKGDNVTRPGKRRRRNEASDCSGTDFCAGLACDMGCAALFDGLLSLLSGWGIGCCG